MWDRILVSSAMSMQAWVKTVWSDVEWVLQMAHGHVFVRSGIRSCAYKIIRMSVGIPV